ncbi:MAG: DUF58 domain-containing protein, partial [Polyangiales bacterium]
MVPSTRAWLLLSLGLPLSLVTLWGGALLWVLPLTLWTLWLGATLFDARQLWRLKPAVEVALPAATGIGDVLSAHVTLELPGGQGLKVHMQGEVTPPLVCRQSLHQALPADNSEWRVPLEATRRGQGSLVALWLRIDGPLGLLQRIWRHKLDTKPVAVVPSMQAASRIALKYFGTAAQTPTLTIRQLQLSAGEFDALQAYQPGMELRLVDWKASARHQALLVRRYRAERHQHLVLCLDSGRLMADAIEGLERLDHAVHAALALGHTALRGGDQVALYAYAEQPVHWLAPGHGLRHMRHLQTACATLRSRDEESNHVLGISALLPKLKRRALVVVFSDFVDATSAERMLHYVGHLAQRHLVVFFALED